MITAEMLIPLMIVGIVALWVWSMANDGCGFNSGDDRK
jgi:hypothetical protein